MKSELNFERGKKWNATTHLNAKREQSVGV